MLNHERLNKSLRSDLRENKHYKKVQQYSNNPRDLGTLLKKLKAIKDRGYIKTHKAGTAGIGKMLEDLLGITENNIPSPNAVKIELKSSRKNASSMLTLFTKSPLPRGVNSELLERFGYPSGNRKGKGANEEFWFNEAWLLSDFDFVKFVN